MQINHAGSAASKDVTGYDPVGPSYIENPRVGNIPKELTKKQIKDIIEDSKIAALEFEKAGIDILDISGGFCGFVLPGVDSQGYFSSLTEEIKKVASIPVILTGGITEVNAAEKLISEKKADLIAVGRAIYKDSKWAEKAIKSLK